MTTAMEALLLLILIFCLVLAVYFVFAIVSICYFLCCCDQRRARIEKRQPEPESPPTADQADIHQVEEGVEKVATCARTRTYQRSETVEKRHPVPVLAATSGQAEVNQAKGNEPKVATRARVYPDLEKLIPDSNILQGPAKTSTDPKKVILTVENEKSDTNYYQKSPAKASKNGVTGKSKTTQSLPWSTKAKHLYPRCNSAAQACR